MIKQITYQELEICVGVIQKSFGTIAVEFGLTVENCPTNGAFIQVEWLRRDFNDGCLMFGYFINGEIVGFVQLAKKGETSFEQKRLAVLPDCRHKGCGKELLGFCKKKVKELGGNKITLGIIDENTRLKNWYASNGFVYTGAHKFDHLPFTTGFMEMDIE